MTSANLNSIALRNYAETIEALHLRDRKALAARTWGAIVVGTLLVALGVPALIG